jgi:hypothetical protein
MGDGERGQVDLRKATTSLGSALPGYGLTPRSARERGAVVRAITQDQHIRQRPVPVVIVSAVVALVGLGVFGWQLYELLSADPGAGDPPATPGTLLWIGLATFVIAAAICSWAWQLYDVKKAIVMWLAIVALSLLAVVVIAIVLVALKGDGDDIDLGIDLDGLVDRIAGGGARATGNMVDNVVIPVAADTLDAAANGGFDGYVWGAGTEEETTPEPAAQQAAPGEPACPSCGRALTPGLLICPRCGSPLDGIA